MMGIEDFTTAQQEKLNLKELNIYITLKLIAQKCSRVLLLTKMLTIYHMFSGHYHWSSQYD